MCRDVRSDGDIEISERIGRKVSFQGRFRLDAPGPRAFALGNSRGGGFIEPDLDFAVEPVGTQGLDGRGRDCESGVIGVLRDKEVLRRHGGVPGCGAVICLGVLLVEGCGELECETECDEEHEHDDDVQNADCAGFAADARHRDTSIFSETGTSTLIVFDILMPSKLPTEIKVGIL